MFNSFKEDIDKNLEKIISQSYELYEALAYSLFPGGKRIRPLFMLAALSDLNYNYKLALDIACSLEMIHSYSLIHDDLPAMDNDDFRRGKPSLHIAFGEDIAILTGDYLLTEAFNVLAKADFNANTKIELIKLLAECSGANGMIRGQVLDLKYSESDFEHINLIHTLKTARLFEFSLCACKIILNDNDDIYADIANKFGHAFQIADDLDDIDKLELTNMAKVIGYAQAQKLFSSLRTECLTLIEKKFSKKLLYKLVEEII